MKTGAVESVRPLICRNELIGRPTPAAGLVNHLREQVAPSELSITPTLSRASTRSLVGRSSSGATTAATSRYGS
jgi:hypothetical protein